MTAGNELQRRIRRNVALLTLLAVAVYGGYYLMLMWRNPG